MAAFTAVSLLALALVLSLSPSVHAVTCRQGPLAASQYCALPYALGNFQGDPSYRAATATPILAMDKQRKEDILSSLSHGTCCGTE